MEIVNGASRTGLSIEDFLIKARESGLDTIPGTAAEILDDEVRWVLTKGKLPAATWIEVVTTAHRVGLRSSSTMMYGHVDNPRHWVGHLRVLRRIQDETGGLHRVRAAAVRAPLVADLPRRRRPTRARPCATTSPCTPWPGSCCTAGSTTSRRRWVKLGVDGTRAMLQAGANDLGGTLMEETISRMAGSEHGSAKTVGRADRDRRRHRPPGPAARHDVRRSRGAGLNVRAVGSQRPAPSVGAVRPTPARALPRAHRRGVLLGARARLLEHPARREPRGWLVL